MRIPIQIVVPTDFSPSSMSAIRVAGKLAQIFEAKVTLLHVFQYVPKHRYNTSVARMARIIRTDVRKNLVDAKRILHEAGVETEVMVLEDGIPAQQILALVESFEAPLLTMGTHAVERLERFILGSTAEEVLRQAHCPVVTVGPHVHFSLGNETFLERILFATDFSKASLAAVPGLFAIQKATGAQLQLFHVSADHAQDVDETQEFDSVRRLLGTDVGAKYAALHGANIAQAVVNEAERYHADLLVLGVKRASAFIAHVAPKTTFRIIAASPCAVLTVSS